SSTFEIVKCDAAQGMAGDPSAPLASGKRNLVGAFLTAVPSNAVEGSRRVAVGMDTFPISAEGVVASDSLPQLASTPQLLAVEGDKASIPVGVELVEPIDVVQVPAAALWAVQRTSACVSYGKRAFS